MSDLDKSKFGYKMLQKMGWSEGKGLGAAEDGALEHVKVKMKCDTSGSDLIKLVHNLHVLAHVVSQWLSTNMPNKNNLEAVIKGAAK